MVWIESIERSCRWQSGHKPSNEAGKTGECLLGGRVLLGHSFRHCVLICVLAATVAGCAFSKLEKDLARLQDVSHVFSGTIYAENVESGAFVVVAMRDHRGEGIASFRMMSGTGRFEIILEAVPLYFFAFDDLNKDLRFQADEPYGWAARGQPVIPSEVETNDIEISIDAVADDQPMYPQQLIDEPLVEHIDDLVTFNIGTVSSLENSWFSEEQGKKGLWEPFAFMEDGGDRYPFSAALRCRQDSGDFRAWYQRHASQVHYTR